jgi:hypothetical protein
MFHGFYPQKHLASIQYSIRQAFTKSAIGVPENFLFGQNKISGLFYRKQRSVHNAWDGSLNQSSANQHASWSNSDFHIAGHHA